MSANDPKRTLRSFHLWYVANAINQTNKSLCAIKAVSHMEWKLQLISSVFYLIVITAGFALIPKEAAMFGMGMIPGPLGLFSTIGFPIIASIAIGFAVFSKSAARKAINTTFFLVGSIIIWLIAFILFN